MRIDASGRLPPPPHVRASDLSQDLHAYLDLGYEVRSAADGWAELCCGDRSFVLVLASLPVAASLAPVHLRVVGSAISSSAVPAGPPEPAVPIMDLGKSEVQAC